MMLRQPPQLQQLQQLQLPDIGLFPLQKYWRWEVIKKTEKLNPKQKSKVLDRDVSGWLYWVHVRADNPDVLLQLDLASLPYVAEIDVTFRMLYEMGATNSVGGFRLLRYDDVNKVYSAEFAPGILGLLGAPFRDKIRVTVTNPTDHEVTYSISALVILL
jgi:hypothetical protein